MDEMDYLEDFSNRITTALEFAMNWSQFDGSRHKAWAIDQMVRILTGGTNTSKDDFTTTEEYDRFIAERRGPLVDGDFEYGWDVGIPP